MLTVNELFAGIGSQRAALERLGIKHKVVGIAEIDKFAIKSYEAIWGETKNYGDISKVDKLNYADFWTYSFPCQDISVAGKQAGIEHGKTRSGLLYEVERLLEKSKECVELPKYLMLENVKNLVGKKFKPQFEEWITRLDELGYNTYWQVLNAKNYGIPQNRERVFGISIRKDIDTGYVFPEPFELNIRLRDVLENEVDEKYYINNDRMNVLLKNLELSKVKKDTPDVSQIGNCVESKGDFKNPQRGRVYSENGCSPALNCVGGGGLEPKILKMGNINPSGNGMNGNVFSQEGLSPTIITNKGEGLKVLESVIAASRGRNPENPSDRTAGSPTKQRLEINQNGTSNTITTVQKDNYVLEPNVLTPKRTEYGKAIRKDYESGLISESRHNMTELQPREDGICNTLTTVQKDNYVVEPNNIKHTELPCIYDDRDKGFGIKTSNICPTQRAERYGIKCIETDYRIRKLTPLECWRLMGFTDEQFQKAQDAGISNSQLYKQAGNSIVVDVLYYIFRNLFTEKPKYRVQIDDEEQLLGQISILDFMN